MKTELEIRKLMRELNVLTDNNNHNGSVLELATFLNDVENIDKMKSIINKHERIGHMTTELMLERRGINIELLNQVEKIYGIETKNMIYGCF